MTDYKHMADTLRVYKGFGETVDLSAAIALCDVAAKAAAEIDPEVERRHVEAALQVAFAGNCNMQHWSDWLLCERTNARLQATLAAHAAYRELTDALAEFFYCGDPDDLKRVERAYEKTRGL